MNTEAEEKLVDFLLHYGSASPMMQRMIDAVADERRAIANVHPYGHIAESMLVIQRRPELYGFSDSGHRINRRDVCDPTPGNKSYGL